MIIIRHDSWLWHIYYLLVSLQFSAHHSEGVVTRVVEDVHFAHSLTSSASRDPALPGVIIQHYSSSCLAQIHFTEHRGDRVEKLWPIGSLISNMIMQTESYLS